MRLYIQSYPDAISLGIIGDYNSESQVTKQWGFFSILEMEALLNKFRDENDREKGP